MTNYSQIIYLDNNLTIKVKEIQKKIFDLTGSKACLEIREPHLTIGDGITIHDKDMEVYSQQIQKILEKFKPFQIKIKNYNFMDNWSGGNLPGHSKYVIYLNVVINKEIKGLAKSIKDLTSQLYLSWYKQPLPYNPHITIAYKDLSKENFEKISEILKKETFVGITQIDHIAIAKQNGIGKRIEYKRFKLS